MEEQCRVGVALYAAEEEGKRGRGSMRQAVGRGAAGAAGSLVAAVLEAAESWACRAEPSTRRDLGWLLWKETRQESEEEQSQRGGRERLDRLRGESGLGASVREGCGGPECSESELPLGSESRNARNPPPPPVREPSTVGARAAPHGSERAREIAVPRFPPGCVHRLWEIRSFTENREKFGRKLIISLWILTCFRAAKKHQWIILLV